MEPDFCPNPRRFDVFIELSNGKGFKLKNSKYIYFFDKYGGWFDQYNNYYNADGQPEDPPSDEDDDFEKVILEEDYDRGNQDDYYDNVYGHNQSPFYDEAEDQSSSEHQKIIEAITHNKTELNQYPLKTPVRVDFQNMPFKACKQEILKHYRSKIGHGVSNVVLRQKEGKFAGEGHFVCQEASTASKLVQYEGEQFLGRKIYFDVEPFREYLVDPVKKQQLNVAINENDFESLLNENPSDSKTTQKKYLLKNQTTLPNSQKKEQQKNLNSCKPEEKEKKKKNEKQIEKLSEKQNQKRTENQLEKQINKKNEKHIGKQVEKDQIEKLAQVTAAESNSWDKYYGEVTMFPLKTSFKEWMSQLGLKQNVDFKNPQKVENNTAEKNKVFATIEFKNSVYSKIQGKQYQGTKVYFKKLN